MRLQKAWPICARRKNIYVNIMIWLLEAYRSFIGSRRCDLWHLGIYRINKYTAPEEENMQKKLERYEYLLGSNYPQEGSEGFWDVTMCVWYDGWGEDFQKLGSNTKNCISLSFLFFSCQVGVLMSSLSRATINIKWICVYKISGICLLIR